MNVSRRGFAALLGLVAACGDATAPGSGGGLEFSLALVALDASDSATVEIRNAGPDPIGPIELRAGPARLDGLSSTDVRLVVSPAEIPTLNPGGDRTLTVTAEVPPCAAPGRYTATVEARLDGIVEASAAVEFEAPERGTVPVGSVGIVSGPEAVRQGDAALYGAVARGPDGGDVEDICIVWRVLPPDAGFVDRDGWFVGYVAGSARLVAGAGDAADTLEVSVTPRGLAPGAVTTVGRGSVIDRFTSDLWVHPTAPVAYTGTWGSRIASGNTLHVWDIADPAVPSLVHSVVVDARTVNDVKVRADGQLAVITHELSNDQRNGITLLDLRDPARPEVIFRFTQGLEPGVHNAWIDGDHLYLVVDNASPSSGLRILDVSRPERPQVVASFYGGSSFLHDVIVRDGLAFLAHWNAGLIILDVGHGIAGGSPERPVEVSRIATEGGQTHNAWYWPDAGYVFVGEEDFGTPGGVMHVVDARDLRRPREVAVFRVPGAATPHNFWLDENRGLLYLAWYDGGLRILDVTGELRGELHRQGREIAGAQYAGAGTACPADRTDVTCTWAPQLHGGLVYVADMNTGIWILRPEF